MTKRSLYMGITIASILSIFTFTFDSNEIKWVWGELWIIPIVLAIFTIVFGVLWFLETKVESRIRAIFN